MAFTTKYQIFHFVLFHYFLVPHTGTISAEPSPESLQLGRFIFVQELDILKMCISFITQHLQIVRINYKIIKYFPASTHIRLVVCN